MTTLLNFGFKSFDNNDILRLINGDGRYYHNLDHVMYLLKYDQSPLMVAASWFHDIIYDVRSDQNEIWSARYAMSIFSEKNVLNVNLPLLEQIILDTATHQPQSTESAYFSDMDMSILGDDLINYNRYRRAVRLEWNHVPWDDYKNGRSTFLKKINMQQIFKTNDFLSLENAAHDNIECEINDLENMNYIEFFLA